MTNAEKVINMRTSTIKTIGLGMAMALATIPTVAQTVAGPVLHKHTFNDNSQIMNLSDNGDWAVFYGPSPTDATRETNARLVNTRTNTVTELALEGSEPLTCAAADVTDDGTVVGFYMSDAATWTKADGWQTLPKPTGWPSARVYSVTPDGHYAVGIAYNYNKEYYEQGVVWDLTTRAIVETPNAPTKGMADETAKMIRYTDISSDGRYILGVVDFSYTWNTLYFMYDRQTQTWTRTGFNPDGTTWMDGLVAAEAKFSPNGKWLGGNVYVITENGTNYDEYNVPFRYNMETKTFERFDENQMRDFETIVIDNEGTLYAATPRATPVRSLYMRVGKFWYPLDEMLTQRYGYDFYAKTGFDNTGSCIGVSGDGKTLACFPDPYTSYTLQLSETTAQAAGAIDLLATYTATPIDGSSITQLKSVDIQFSRAITVKGSTGDISLTDGNGQSVGRVTSLNTPSTSTRTLHIGFRTLTLDEGTDYTLTIPAGTVALADDATRTNSEIKLHYKGRAKAPVAVKSVSPAEGTTLTQLNATTNPVLLTFDTDVALTDEASAALYRDGDDNPIASLNAAAKGNQVMLFPSTTEYLYLNSTYKVVLEAGSVTDINGDNANERFAVGYEGTYERIIMADDTLMYSEDFTDGVAGMMLYEGDHNNPTTEMKGYDFIDGNGYPWIPVRDEGSTDFAAASTSAYSPAGKSDDWMVTPQIYIPDAKCRLTFVAQGFRKAKSDRLKVIVYASEKTINYIGSEEVALMRADGEVLMDEVVLPGTSEDNLAGDWTSYSFALDKYAQRNIYIAFVNENEDQSIVFVDNVKVVHDSGFLTALTSPVTVVAQTAQTVTGRITANSDTHTYTTLNLRLLDAKKNLIDEISETGLAMKKGDRRDFSFARQLPLTIGERNTFYLRVQMDETFDTITYTVKDLAFQPVKRVVIEKMTGQDCGNCPRGILAFENLEKIYGDRIVPIAYHTYTGDTYESGMTAYTSFIGLNGAPSASINRSVTSTLPMYETLSAGQRTWTYTSPSHDTWFDLVQAEFENDTEAEINLGAATFDAETSRVKVVPTIRFAMNAERQNIGLLLVITEDGLSGYQHNYYYSSTDDGLGEWTSGGAYGQQYVYPYTFDHVARAMVGTSFNGTTGHIPATVENGHEYRPEITFDKPAVDDIYNCRVVCIMLDANTGAVINVAQAPIRNTTGISATNADTTDDVETARYNMAGQKISAPQHGINIVRHADGSVRKVIVK